ncbi:hypothetical protein AXF15_10465 [Desulfomicrobium orale DSM 12838]|uniref:TPM domain-containing protein n=1 Tax=Desulfomicrobium orale DSM 12838 TaxID=888061 RepID=A0A0X8JS25_9BACT|nr:hypothetical protein AXF15_10465 [Desulfomicrobium orale DSM 12838]
MLQALDVPPLTARVMDMAGILSANTTQELETRLQLLEAENGTQIAVLTIDSLDGENLEEYTLRVAETWGLGQRGMDNGALLLIAVQDRQMRIEVGYGLEDRLTDLMAGRIINERIIPFLRKGNFNGGVRAGVQAMIIAARGEDPFTAANTPDISPLAETAASEQEQQDEMEDTLVEALLGGSFLAGLLFRRILLSMAVGAILGFIFGLFMPTEYAWASSAMVGAFCALFASAIRRMFSGGDFSGGGGSSGSSSSGSSSSGGFSGGGGGFGGGGASGRW